MTHNLPDLDMAVRNALTGSTAVTSLVGGTVSPRIYAQQVPSGVVRPYIVFYEASGLPTNRTPHIDFDHIYRVEAAAENRAAAETLRGAIFATLHHQPVSVSGYTNYQLECTRLTGLIDNNEGKQVYRRIGDYRIRLSET